MDKQVLGKQVQLDTQGGDNDDTPKPRPLSPVEPPHCGAGLKDPRFAPIYDGGAAPPGCTAHRVLPCTEPHPSTHTRTCPPPPRVQGRTAPRSWWSAPPPSSATGTASSQSGARASSGGRACSCALGTGVGRVVTPTCWLPAPARPAHPLARCRVGNYSGNSETREAVMAGIWAGHTEVLLVTHAMLWWGTGSGGALPMEHCLGGSAWGGRGGGAARLAHARSAKRSDGGVRRAGPLGPQPARQPPPAWPPQSLQDPSRRPLHRAVAPSHIR